jgi:hypothetical protein|tara:strand:- start:95 stop:931 length:837 start_codon:yes stop_codon:yes gene_type:complete
MAINAFGKIVKNVGTGILNRTVGRLFGSGITGNSNHIKRATARWSGRADSQDWRVKLTVPNGPLTSFFDFDTNPLMQPLAGIGGIFWPLTPSMVIQHSANYNAMDMTHSNFPHQAYQNSQVDSLNIIGEYPVQNQQDAQHWVATVNFLRTATKMFFGRDDDTGLKGNPPPILHLSGYGDHMFQKVPVVLNSFNVELRSGIDYISTKQESTSFKQLNGPDAGYDLSANSTEPMTWAPTLSNISVLVTPIYSRESVKNFSMKKFVRGELNGKGDNEVGFI